MSDACPTPSLEASPVAQQPLLEQRGPRRGSLHSSLCHLMASYSCPPVLFTGVVCAHPYELCITLSMSPLSRRCDPRCSSDARAANVNGSLYTIRGGCTAGLLRGDQCGRRWRIMSMALPALGGVPCAPFWLTMVARDSCALPVVCSHTWRTRG